MNYKLVARKLSPYGYIAPAMVIFVISVFPIFQNNLSKLF